MVVCPRVVSVKGNGKLRVPVKMCNITAKPVVIKPKTVLCEFGGVTVVRDDFDDQTETFNEEIRTVLKNLVLTSGRTCLTIQTYN